MSRAFQNPCKEQKVCLWSHSFSQNSNIDCLARKKNRLLYHCLVTTICRVLRVNLLRREQRWSIWDGLWQKQRYCMKIGYSVSTFFFFFCGCHTRAPKPISVSCVCWGAEARTNIQRHFLDKGLEVPCCEKPFRKSIFSVEFSNIYALPFAGVCLKELCLSCFSQFCWWLHEVRYRRLSNWYYSCPLQVHFFFKGFAV